MTYKDVHRLLSENPGRAKIISLSDGRRVRVEGSEQWLAGPPWLHVLHRNGEYEFIQYRTITSIRVAGRNNRR